MPSLAACTSTIADAVPSTRMGGGIELVIFDCDGVLVDSERIAVRVESQLLTSLGWPLSQADVLERFVGRTDAEMLAEIERQLGRAVPEWPSLYEEHVYRALATELQPVSGIEAALDALTCLTCVASNGTHARMQITLGVTGLHARFAGRIFSATEVANGKPAPDLFLHAAAQMGVAPEHTLVVEDSRSGVAAARAAGMPVLGYAGGITPADWLVGPSTTVFHDMAELPGLVASLGALQSGLRQT